MDAKKILIVEDEAIIAMETENNLISLGYEIAGIVDSGEKAIQLLEEVKADLVLMDIRIKGDADGIVTADKIRSNYGIPIVFCTAFLDQSRIERAKITMPFGYVLKPIQPRDLKVTLQMAFYVAQIDTERTKVEAELKASEQRYENLFRNMRSGVAIYEVIGDAEDFIFVDYNKSAEAIDKQKKEDLIGKSVFEVRPNIEDFGLIDVFKRVWKTGIPESLPTKLYKDNRHQKWYENFVYRLSSGEIVAIFNDETEKMQKNRIIESIVFRMGIATKAARTGIWDFDVNKNLMVWDEMMYELYGIRDRAIDTYDAWLDLLHPDDRAEFEFKGTPSVKKGTSFNNSEFRIIRPDKTIRYISAYSELITDKDGKPSRLIGVNFDITNRKEAEQRLKRNDAYLRTLLETATEMIWALDIDNRLIEANKTFLDRINTFSKIEIKQGDLILDLLPSEVAEAWSVYYARAFKGEKVVIHTGKTISKSEVKAEFYPIFDEDKATVLGVVTKSRLL